MNTISITIMALCLSISPFERAAGSDSLATKIVEPNAVIDSQTAKSFNDVASKAVERQAGPDRLLFEILQTVGIFSGVIAVGLLWFQIREQNRISRATVLADIAQRTETINALIFQNPDLARYINDGADPAKFDEIIDVRVSSYYYHVLNVLEEIFDYKKLNLIENEDWVAWKSSFLRYVSQKAFRQQWPQIRDEYSKGFQDLIDELLRQSKIQINTTKRNPINPLADRTEDVS